MSRRYDPDQIVTSETGKRMLKRVSPIYSNAYVAKWLYQVMGLEFDEVWKYVKELRDQIYTSRVTWGIEYQEHKYSITPDNTLSLQERRDRLRRHQPNYGPLNPAILEKYIRDNFNLDTDIDESQSGILQINFNNPITLDIQTLHEILYSIKPSHLSLHYNVLIWGFKKIYVGARTSYIKQDIYIPPPTRSPATTGGAYCGGKIIYCRRDCIIPAQRKLATAGTAHCSGKIVLHRTDYIT